MIPPTADEVLARAAEAAGTDDFGPPGFAEGLARNLDAFGRMPLTPTGLAGAVARLTGDLATRARVLRWHRDHPEAESRAIEGPVLVCGLPRTGTTATVAMLALDERFRFLRAWEGQAPLPPPVLGEEDADPRALAARAAARAYEQRELHLHDPDGPEEDLAFFAGLDCHAYHGTLPVPRDYRLWWARSDFTSTYAMVGRVLQLLQSRRPPHLWLLKAPAHLFHLAAFARRFPNARYVMTHRDPAKVIPSTASLQHQLQQANCPAGALDKAEGGRLMLDLWREGMERGLAARAAIGEERFIDVRNEDVVRRPVETFAAIYAHIGLDLTPALRRRIEDYAKANRPGAFGAHHYTAEEFGLSAAGIREAFAGYVARFAL